jgi:hypothetical protein
VVSVSAAPGVGRSSGVVKGSPTALPDKWTYDAGVSVSYQADMFGKIARAVEAANADTQAAQAGVDLVRVTVAADTARAYADACAAVRQIAVAQQAVDLQQKFVALTDSAPAGPRHRHRRRPRPQPAGAVAGRLAAAASAAPRGALSPRRAHRQDAARDEHASAAMPGRTSPDQADSGRRWRRAAAPPSRHPPGRTQPGLAPPRASAWRRPTCTRASAWAPRSAAPAC